MLAPMSPSAISDFSVSNRCKFAWDLHSLKGSPILYRSAKCQGWHELARRGADRWVVVNRSEPQLRWRNDLTNGETPWRSSVPTLHAERIMTSSFGAKRLVVGGLLAVTLVGCGVVQVASSAGGIGAAPCEHSTPADGSCARTETDAGTAPEAAAAMADSAACPGLDVVCGSDADAYSCVLAWSTASNVSSWCQRASPSALDAGLSLVVWQGCSGYDLIDETVGASDQFTRYYYDSGTGVLVGIAEIPNNRVPVCVAGQVAGVDDSTCQHWSPLEDICAAMDGSAP